MTFGTNRDVQLTAPDRTTSSNLFPVEATAFFNTTVFPYIGIQPYGLSYPSVLWSHFGVTGVASPLDDSFADLSNWDINVAGNCLLGVAVHPPDMVYEPVVRHSFLRFGVLETPSLQPAGPY